MQSPLWNGQRRCFFRRDYLWGIHNLSPGDAVNFASASSAMKHTITKDVNFATVEEIQNIVALGGMDVKR